jgi:hypothetical protein
LTQVRQAADPQIIHGCILFSQQLAVLISISNSDKESLASSALSSFSFYPTYQTAAFSALGNNFGVTVDGCDVRPGVGRELMPSSPGVLRPTRRTRIVCISDTHNSTVRLPKGDVLIHAGDLTNQGSYSEVRSLSLGTPPMDRYRWVQ